MEEYRRIVKRRLTVQCVLTAVAVVLVAGAAVGVFGFGWVAGADDGFLGGFNLGLPVGVMTAFVLLACLQIARIRRALKSDEALRKMQVEEQDERQRMIRDKIGGFGFDFSMGLVLVAGVIASLFSSTVGFTLFMVLLGMALVKAGLKLYFYRKY